MAYEEYYGGDPRIAALMRKRKLAEALMKTGSDTSPAATPFVGLSRVLQGLVGAWQTGTADEEARKMGEAGDAEVEAAKASLNGFNSTRPEAGLTAPAPAMVAPQEAVSRAPLAPDEMMPLFQKASEETGIPVPLLLAQADVESKFNPNAVSKTGARGVMQVLESTARDPGYGLDPVDPSKLSDPSVNIPFGARYLLARGKAAGVTDWNDTSQVSKALRAYSGADTPQGDKEYDRKVLALVPPQDGAQTMAFSGQPAPQQVGLPAPGPAAPPPWQAYAAEAERLSIAGTEFAASRNPRTRDLGKIMLQKSQFLQSRVEAMMSRADTQAFQQQTRADAQANRVPPTITMQDPDGSIGIYERTPQGVGRRIGNAPKQPGEGGGPFAGTGMDQQANNILLQVGPKIAEGTATQAEQSQYALAYQHIANGKVAMVPDPSDPTGQRQVMARIPGAVPSQFPAPPGMPGASQPGEAVQPGMPQPIPGTTKPAPPLTESQGRVATFADRIATTMPIIDQMEKEGLSYRQQGLKRVPLIGNSLISKEMQQLDQAQRNFINAVLRRESGAVISDEEFANAEKQYFPRPGDSKETLAQKRKNRQDVMEGFARESGPQYKLPQAGAPEPKSEPKITPEQAIEELKRRGKM